MKVLTVVGTRPEVIRLSRVIPVLDASVDHVLAHTGQNADPNLNEIFFHELGLRSPDYQFGVKTSSLGRMLADILVSTEEVIELEKPDAFLVLGDTNSALSALMAKRMNIPVYHMEAGNRCFDENVPEETNRRTIDHLADFNLVYTEHARRNLLQEGLPTRRIIKTGSPMREVIEFYSSSISDSKILNLLQLSEQQFILVSAHRQENVDSPERLDALLSCLEAIAREWGFPVLVSTHPRTRQRLERKGNYTIDGVSFHEPFGFFDYCHLQTRAFCVVSDSGTISEEAAILGFPAVTTRSSIERPEALDAGVIITTDLRPKDLIDGIQAARSDYTSASLPDDYAPTNTSVRVRNFILSTAHEHEVWAGLR